MGELDTKLKAIVDYVVGKVEAAIAPDGALRKVKAFLPDGRRQGHVDWPIVVLSGKRLDSEPMTSARSIWRLTLTFLIGHTSFDAEGAVQTIEDLALALADLFETAGDWPAAVMDLETSGIDLRASAGPDESNQPWVSVEQVWRFETDRMS